MPSARYFLSSSERKYPKKRRKEPRFLNLLCGARKTAFSDRGVRRSPCGSRAGGAWKNAVLFRHANCFLRLSGVKMWHCLCFSFRCRTALKCRGWVFYDFRRGRCPHRPGRQNTVGAIHESPVCGGGVFRRGQAPALRVRSRNDTENNQDAQRYAEGSARNVTGHRPGGCNPMSA
jgi:hypothetical protein